MNKKVPVNAWSFAQTVQSRWTATRSRLTDALTSVIPTIFTQDALPYTTLPNYPGLGQAPKYAGLHTQWLGWLPSGLVQLANPIGM